MHKILKDGIVDVTRIGDRIIIAKVLGQETLNIVHTSYICQQVGLREEIETILGRFRC